MNTALPTIVVLGIFCACPPPDSSDDSTSDPIESNSSVVASTDSWEDDTSTDDSQGSLSSTDQPTSSTDVTTSDTTSAATSGGTDADATDDGSDVTTTVTVGCEPLPGQAMGPCVVNACDAGLTCVVVIGGTFCAPTCESCADVEHHQCIVDLSTNDAFTCLLGQPCGIPCPMGQDDCEGGTVCDDRTKRCVWPTEPLR